MTVFILNYTFVILEERSLAGISQNKKNIYYVKHTGKLKYNAF